MPLMRKTKAGKSSSLFKSRAALELVDHAKSVRGDLSDASLRCVPFLLPSHVTPAAGCGWLSCWIGYQPGYLVRLASSSWLLVGPALTKYHSTRNIADRIVKDPTQALGNEARAALEGREVRRTLFLRCSGMHTAEVQEVIKLVCGGRVQGPGLAYVVPALLEGIPEYLMKITDGLDNLATCKWPARTSDRSR